MMIHDDGRGLTGNMQRMSCTFVLCFVRLTGEKFVFFMLVVLNMHAVFFVFPVRHV